ncbi:hypothetical protein [Seonamhaeicola sediminis]|uniref:hypothetical protein n=1 Tax=Seonamhaeicola sediminis TaxID=2528206 RepID=UPI00164896DB|nr:hypothetical protein [Seonamhaeicola sediminis]
MLEGIADLLVAVLDLFLIGSSSKKKRHIKIDKIIENWAKKLGLYLQTNYKEEKVRSLSVVDDAGNSYQIWIENLKWSRLKVNVSNNQSIRNRKLWSKKCKTSSLTKVLFEAYGMTEQWILESGNKRTIK